MSAASHPSWILWVASWLLAPPGPWEPAMPDHVALYYSGAPCDGLEVDRTFSQFQVNLSPEPRLWTGEITADEDGAALLRASADPPLRLVSNASRADWLLGYPGLDTGAAVWGREILRADCSTRRDEIYADAIYPRMMIDPEIDPRLDLFGMPERAELQRAVTDYRGALAGGEPSWHAVAASRLERELFDTEAAQGTAPWRVALLEGTEIYGDSFIDVVLSGSDGSAGMFGHVALGIDGMVYNVYPKGSERGASEPVPLGEYLFSGQRGQALRRPNWLLRLDGIPGELASEIRQAIEAEIDAMQSGERPYHPTGNNCTTACVRSLEHLGFKVGKARYFSRRFPRPVFSRMLLALPHLIDAERLPVSRVELWFVAQVPVPDASGKAPNRPMWDRSRLD